MKNFDVTTLLLLLAALLTFFLSCSKKPDPKQAQVTVSFHNSTVNKVHE